MSLRKCNIFRERINGCKLIDIGTNDPKFTWHGLNYQGRHVIYEKLDQVLCNEMWKIDFLDAFVKVLALVEFFDHHPIIITHFNILHNKKQKQLKFKKAWHLMESYHDMLTKV